MHTMELNDIWEQKLFPLLIVRGWKYRRGGENIVTIFSSRGEDIVGWKYHFTPAPCELSVLSEDKF